MQMHQLLHTTVAVVTMGQLPSLQFECFALSQPVDTTNICKTGFKSSVSSHSVSGILPQNPETPISSHGHRKKHSILLQCISWFRNSHPSKCKRTHISDPMHKMIIIFLAVVKETMCLTFNWVKITRPAYTLAPVQDWRDSTAWLHVGHLWASH